MFARWLVFFGLFVFTVTAMADEVVGVRRTSAPVQTAYAMQGIFVDAAGGWGWLRTTSANSNDRAGFTWRGGVGASYALSQMFLVGGEVVYQPFADASSQFNGANVKYSQSQWGVLATLHYFYDYQSALYLKGGYVHVKQTVNMNQSVVTPSAASFSNSQWEPAIEAGFSRLIAPHLLLNLGGEMLFGTGDNMNQLLVDRAAGRSTGAVIVSNYSVLLGLTYAVPLF